MNPNSIDSQSRSKKEILSLYQNEINDIRNRKAQEKMKRIEEERRNIEIHNQKLLEEKQREQQIKNQRMNQGLADYQQFLLRKQESKSKKSQQNQLEDNFYTGTSNPYVKNSQGVNYNPSTYTNNLPDSNNINQQMYEQQKKILTENSQQNQNPYANQEYNQNQNNQGYPNIQQSNQPKENYYPEEMYNDPELLKNLNDPNFDYNKYEEIMQKYSREQLSKENPNQGTPGVDPNSNKYYEELENQMQNLNLNNQHNHQGENRPAENQFDNIDPAQIEEYYRAMAKNMNNQESNIPQGIHSESKQTPQNHVQDYYNKNQTLSNPQIKDNISVTAQSDRSGPISNYQYNQMNYLKNKNANQVSNITHNYNFSKNPNLANKTDLPSSKVVNYGIAQQNQNEQKPNQSEYYNNVKSQKYENQISYKNYLDSQIKEKSSIKDNFKVNEFKQLQRKDQQIITNPYSMKNYEFGGSYLKSNVFANPTLDYAQYPQQQTNLYQDRNIQNNQYAYPDVNNYQIPNNQNPNIQGPNNLIPINQGTESRPSSKSQKFQNIGNRIIG